MRARQNVLAPQLEHLDARGGGHLSQRRRDEILQRAWRAEVVPQVPRPRIATGFDL